MTDYEMHEPDFSGTTTEESDEPQLEDFDISERSSDGQRDSDESRQTDDLGEVADHFILSSSGSRRRISQRYSTEAHPFRGGSKCVHAMLQTPRFQQI